MIEASARYGKKRTCNGTQSIFHIFTPFVYPKTRFIRIEDLRTKEDRVRGVSSESQICVSNVRL